MRALIKELVAAPDVPQVVVAPGKTLHCGSARDSISINKDPLSLHFLKVAQFLRSIPLTWSLISWVPPFLEGKDGET